MKKIIAAVFLLAVFLGVPAKAQPRSGPFPVPGGGGGLTNAGFVISVLDDTWAPTGNVASATTALTVSTNSVFTNLITQTSFKNWYKFLVTDGTNAIVMPWTNLLADIAFQSGGTLYVDPNGTAAGPGYFSFPFALPSQAAAALPSRWTIKVADGTYDEGTNAVGQLPYGGSIVGDGMPVIIFSGGTNNMVPYITPATNSWVKNLAVAITQNTNLGLFYNYACIVGWTGGSPYGATGVHIENIYGPSDGTDGIFDHNSHPTEIFVRNCYLSGSWDQFAHPSGSNGGSVGYFWNCTFDSSQGHYATITEANGFQAGNGHYYLYGCCVRNTTAFSSQSYAVHNYATAYISIFGGSVTATNSVGGDGSWFDLEDAGFGGLIYAPSVSREDSLPLTIDGPDIVAGFSGNTFIPTNAVGPHGIIQTNLNGVIIGTGTY